MKIEPALVGARGADSLPFSSGGTVGQAVALKAAGYDFFVGYLGAMNAARLGHVLAAGLAFMPVTFGGEYLDGADDEIAQLKALGIPAGCSVWLDMEGLKAFRTDPAKLIAMVNAWADAIASGGWMPCLYVGVPQPLTSAELNALHVVRYWKGQGSVRDRNNALAEPSGCGWTMTQMFPSVVRGGVLIDANIVGQDYKARVPTWAVATLRTDAVTLPDLAAAVAQDPPSEPTHAASSPTIHPLPDTVAEFLARDTSGD